LGGDRCLGSSHTRSGIAQGSGTLPVEASHQDAILGSDAVTVHGGAPLHVQAGVKVEVVDAESIRELIDIVFHFSGVDPIDGGQQPVKDMQLEFEIEASDPQDLPAVIKVLKVRDGQVVADLTKELEAVEARLAFLAEAKAWSLTLELTGLILPLDGIISPTMYHPIAGAVTASLEVGPDHLPAHVRVGEVRSAGPALEVRAEDEVDPLDKQTIRERVETAYFLTGIDPIDPNPQPASPHDMTIAFDPDPAGSVLPCFLHHIPSSASGPKSLVTSAPHGAGRARVAPARARGNPREDPGGGPRPRPRAPRGQARQGAARCPSDRWGRRQRA
jgi:hypothetical protein